MNQIAKIPAGIAFPADAAALAEASLRENARTMEAVIAECLPDILSASRLVAEAMANGCKLMICGNGGSAGDSQHIAAEFVSVLNQNFPRPGLPAIALTTDSSMLTASANDFGFDGIFSRQVQALGQSGDILMGITTSGDSKNVMAAIAVACEAGIKTIGLTGGCNGKIDAAVDVAVRVPSKSTQHIQESHIAIGHILCDLVERSLFQREAD